MTATAVPILMCECSVPMAVAGVNADGKARVFCRNGGCEHYMLLMLADATPVSVTPEPEQPA